MPESRHLLVQCPDSLNDIACDQKKKSVHPDSKSPVSVEQNKNSKCKIELLPSDEAHTPDEPADIVYFEDRDPLQQDVIIDLLLSIIENKRNQNEVNL